MRTNLSAVCGALLDIKPSHLSQDFGQVTCPWQVATFSYVTAWDKTAVGKLNPAKCWETREKEE